MAEHRLITTLMRPFFRKGEEASFTLPRALSDTSRVLCLDTGDLSDFLFYMPLINAIRRHFPGCRMGFLIPEKHESLVVPSGFTKQFIIYKDGQINPWRPAFGDLLRQLGSGGYDMAMVMSMQPKPRFELAALASGAALRLGPSHDKSWPSINFEIRPPRDKDLYLGDRLSAAAPFLGLSREELSPRWPLPMEKLRQMGQQVHFHKPNPDQMLIGIDPGLGKSGHAIAQDNLLFLARQLTSQLMCRVLPIGDPDDLDRLKQFEVRLSDVPVGLPRETALDMVLLLAQCDLFIAGNTDFFHFAVAMGIPAIGLFTQSDKACWIPKGRKKVRVLQLKKGQKVEMETLMAIVEEVTEGRAGTPASIMTPEQVAATEKESTSSSDPETPDALTADD